MWKSLRTLRLMEIASVAIILVCFLPGAPANAQTGTVVPETVEADRSEIIAGKRQAIDTTTEQTLKDLYQAYPGSREIVESSVGYAVFNNVGVNVILVGGGGGTGVAVDNATMQRTYMKMVQLEAGLGLGIKHFRAVFVFGTQEVMDNFINKGWEFGAQATAAAKLEDEGSAYQHAVSVSPGLWVYQLTESGLTLEFTGSGTKYFQDAELN